MSRGSWLSRADPAHTLVVAERPDPRVVQVTLSVFVLADIGIRSAGDGELALDPWPAVGLGLVLLATLAAFVVPWPRLPGDVVAVLPILDLAALGMIRAGHEESAAAILVVVPALWLGRQLGRAGALVAAVGVALLTVLPGLLAEGGEALELSRGLLTTVVACWCALAVAFSLERVRSERDQAERRGAELGEALRTIEERRHETQAILDTVDVGLLLVDADGRFVAGNRQYREFIRLAYPGGHGGRVGQTGAVFAADGARRLEPAETPTARAVAGEEFDDSWVWVGEDPLTRRALSVSARSLRDAEGRFQGAVLAAKDLTELRSALAVKERFVGSVSHELRTPLTAVTGYVEVLLERPDLPPQVRDRLGVVERNAARLLRLIDDLLQSAQGVEPVLPVSREECDLAEVVRRCVAVARPVAEAAGLELAAELPEHLVLRVDRERLAQVVDKLLANALMYTPAPGRVTVRLAVDGDRVELAVSDTGVGVAAEDRDRIFTRFFRGSDADAQARPGAGLGLSIVRDVVVSHGGRVEVDSEPGAGSTFRVRLPLRPVAPVTDLPVVGEPGEG